MLLLLFCRPSATHAVYVSTKTDHSRCSITNVRWNFQTARKAQIGGFACDWGTIRCGPPRNNNNNNNDNYYITVFLLMMMAMVPSFSLCIYKLLSKRPHVQCTAYTHAVYTHCRPSGAAVLRNSSSQHSIGSLRATWTKKADWPFVAFRPLARLANSITDYHLHPIYRPTLPCLKQTASYF